MLPSPWDLGTPQTRLSQLYSSSLLFSVLYPMLGEMPRGESANGRDDRRCTDVAVLSRDFKLLCLFLLLLAASDTVFAYHPHNHAT